MAEEAGVKSPPPSFSFSHRYQNRPEDNSPIRQEVARGQRMPERFFRAAALAGELHLIDFSDWDDWELEKVQYRDDAEVSWLLRTGAGERRVVRTAVELDSVLEESASPRAISLYVSEGLIEEATRRWEEMKRSRRL